MRIAAGFSQTCALLADGTARCWGANSNGELGDGTTTRRLTPVAVSGLSRAASITAGTNHMCARLADGTARCWGRNSVGALGDRTTTRRLTPVPVSGLVNAIAVVGGSLHTCALLADGSVRCWGQNTDGQLGDATQTSSLTPRPVVGVAGSVAARDIAGGGLHTCAVRGNGTVACWGYNGIGQIGDGTTTNRSAPVAVSGLTNVAAIASGFFHNCALLASGTVRCWGNNASGELGDNSTTDRLTPVVVNNLSDVIALAGGVEHTCALRATGDVLCWGANATGQIGNNSTSNRLLPTVVSGVSNAVAIAAGGFGHTCALLADGTARCWGWNDRGQLGDATSSTRLTPVPVIGLTSAVAIAAGSEHTCALRADGGIRCWGANFAGQLGDGTQTPKSTANAVPGLTSAVALGTGNEHTCVLVATGGARCWGSNFSGQIGDGTRTTRLSPAAVRTTGPFGLSLPLSGAVQIATGGSHGCALSAGGGVRCWGDNEFGQIGDNTTTGRLRAVSVPSFSLNVDPLVTVDADPRLATVTVLAACDDGQQLQVDVALTQGATTGHGAGVGDCTGSLERYPVTVSADGGAPFEEGPAQVQAEGVIREGDDVVDTQEWTRQVQVVDTRPSLAGSASGVGTGSDSAGLRLTGRFVAAHGVALDQVGLTLGALLNETGGSGELVRGAGGADALPVTLAARSGSTPTAAIYQTPTGVHPVFWAELKIRDPETAVVDFSIKVDRATMTAGPARCSAASPSTTRLHTGFTLQGDGTPVPFAVTVPWRCLGTQLRTP